MEGTTGGTEVGGRRVAGGKRCLMPENFGESFTTFPNLLRVGGGGTTDRGKPEKKREGDVKETPA